jgi:hypothetical protein
MENKERVENLYNLFNDVSKQLSAELLKRLPDVTIIKECRRQLTQIDKDIRRIQIRKDF